MGTVYTEITLVNAFDEAKERDGIIPEERVRKVTLSAIVDTGAATLMIDEETREKLGLSTPREKWALTANGERIPCKVTEPVMIYWKDRLCSCCAVVLPGAKKILLGAIPLEDMDLTVNPLRQELVGAHGDTVLTLAL
jgi:predicted aspartyl protease